MPLLDRVLALVALTGSENENEARNAAVLACRLIREHKLEIREPVPEPEVDIDAEVEEILREIKNRRSPRSSPPPPPSSSGGRARPEEPAYSVVFLRHALCCSCSRSLRGMAFQEKKNAMRYWHPHCWRLVYG